MKIILIRHGDCAGTHKNTNYELYDSGLSPLGISEIKGSAIVIKEITQDKKIKIITSDARRSVETAIILSHMLEYDDVIRCDTDLQEYRFDEEKPIVLDRYIDIVTNKYKEYNCENPAKLFCRAFACIKRYILSSEADYLVVSTHGGVIMAFLGALRNEGMLKYHINHGAFIVLDECYFV